MAMGAFGGRPSLSMRMINLSTSYVKLTHHTFILLT